MRRARFFGRLVQAPVSLRIYVRNIKYVHTSYGLRELRNLQRLRLFTSRYADILKTNRRRFFFLYSFFFSFFPFSFICRNNAPERDLSAGLRLLALAEHRVIRIAQNCTRFRWFFNGGRISCWSRPAWIEQKFFSLILTLESRFFVFVSSNSARIRRFARIAHSSSMVVQSGLYVLN